MKQARDGEGQRSCRMSRLPWWKLGYIWGIHNLFHKDRVILFQSLVGGNYKGHAHGKDNGGHLCLISQAVTDALLIRAQCDYGCITLQQYHLVALMLNTLLWSAPAPSRIRKACVGGVLSVLVCSQWDSSL